MHRGLGVLTVLLTWAGCSDGTGSDPCRDVACSSRGYCVVVAGRATCNCIAGYRPEGLECVPAEPLDADADADPDGDDATDGPLDEATDAASDVEVVADTPAEAETDAVDPGRPIGAACNLAEQCADGRVPGECLTMVWAFEAVGGYCTALGCRSAEDCPGGTEAAVCAPLFGSLRACVARCGSETDCRSADGLHCIDVDDAGPLPASCLPFCTPDTDCHGDQVCDEAGLPPLCHDPAPQANGQACEHHADCAAGSYCLAERALFGGWPRGYCTQPCDGNGDCSNGGQCVLSCTDDDDDATNDPCDDDGPPGTPDPNNFGRCMDGPCTRTPDSCARPGYSCQGLGPTTDRSRLVCAPDCTEGAACETLGWTCDPFAGAGLFEGAFGLGRCQPPLDTAALGEPCQVTSGCRGAYCIAESIEGFPQGLCAEECGPGDPCPAGFDCSGGGLLAGYCFRPCVPGADDCRAGTRCADVGAGVTTCVADCATNSDCAGGCCHLDATGYCDPTRAHCLP
jgi:hypothetical protein